LRLYIIGVRNLEVETDARYIKGMLANPDIQPSASINRWIVSILTFHFKLVHVKGIVHGPDGLSRRPRQPDDSDEPEDDDFEDWIDELHGFIHAILPIQQSFVTHVFALTQPEPSAKMTRSANPIPDTSDDYDQVPRTPAALKEDERLDLVWLWMDTLERPDGYSDAEYDSFVRYALRFFKDSKRLWRRNTHGAHQLVIWQPRRIAILRAIHNNIGHKRFYATRATLLARFWWPHVHEDISWFVSTCHICQIQQTQKVLIPPIVATPAPLFGKVFIDTMHLPRSAGKKYIVQGRC
jgi:hypothetical protein